MTNHQQKSPRHLTRLGESITSPADLLGSKKPSVLFRPMVGLLSHLLTGQPEDLLSRGSMGLRRLIHPIIKLVGPLLLEHPHVFEDPDALMGQPKSKEKQKLPDTPIIWCANHRFKDDILCTVLSSRHGYILFGSLPAFFNTFDGVAAYLNGVILCNRKIKARKHIAQATTIRALNMGKDMIIFPEGVWNKHPNTLILALWHGIYRAAKETGASIVPVIHYLAEPQKKHKTNKIHTVVGDPISVAHLTEDEAIALLRDTMATWYFLLMERYGRTTREELLSGYDSADEAWADFLRVHTGRIQYYDKEMECAADYRPRSIARPEAVWQAVADIQHIHQGNVLHVQYARELLMKQKQLDYQRRF